ncbi:hypothetical protein SAMN05444007_10344 [Cribrihabitans marinus]|uniref:Phytanoyl-CoA dioxygenase (PhyH) n=1 Tax=Cribrihabitans marinus TaxID=1227549 RepID=A0A1H6V2V7_9RHOB|nr:hypothetical protein [Cribrihabitans marinus]GGH26654.1 hypothetical protein GCM10010973_14530 [Cribrihabitans marinus]SEI97304.1 hypothetical protein SAMN05444007_10344 [Cribrihabitans marinus]
MVEGFETRGWVRFPFDPVLADWVAHARPRARAALDDPALAHWHDCDGTWFVGVDALDNDAQGRVGGSDPLSGQAMRFIADHLGMLPLHRAQVSVLWPGYPRPRRGEGAAAFRYRQTRDAAHVDGLKPTGPDRRRKVQECHAWILGLPLTEAGPDAAPLVVWEGSHRIIRAALAAALADHPRAGWADVDVTDAYQAARREVFDTCRRVPLPARPGEAYVIHRHALHGVAPWAASADAGPDGRMIAYFRPELPGGVVQWIDPS